MTIDIKKHILPNEIIVENKTYKIKTDYAVWLRFIEILNEEEQPLVEMFDFIYANEFEIPANKQAGVQAMFEFCYPKEELPNDTADMGSRRKSFDYNADSTMIYAAFMQCYHIDLIDTPLHWHKFLALFNNITGTRLNEVMGYRGYDKNDKEEYSERMTKLQEMWDLGEIITPEEEALNDKFNSQFD